MFARHPMSVPGETLEVTSGSSSGGGAFDEVRGQSGNGRMSAMGLPE